MNGPQHYAEAERLLATAETFKTEEGDQAGADYAIRRAQIHATLAHAAATALWPAGSSAVSMASMPEFTAWLEVCAVNPDQVKR